jgi:hypothetical protein
MTSARNLVPRAFPEHPWATALYRERRENEGRDNPLACCMPAGVPTIHTIPLPFKILQPPAQLTILYEYNLEYRQIFTDGRSVACGWRPLAWSTPHGSTSSATPPRPLYTSRSVSTRETSETWTWR